ncbi:hypothetical protein [Palleronia sp.]|uniref:hypothetical protein n=1 Tax=Palleronia sp. TaxID=1940284 RepID=UPI0035C86482
MSHDSDKNEKTHNNEKTKKADFGPQGVEPGHESGTGKTKFDKPANEADDTATDERRAKPIRGPEPHRGND